MKKSIAFVLLLGIGVTAQAAPVKMLDLKEENGGCMTEDFQVKRGETYYFQHTVNQTLILTIAPANSRIVVKDPRGRRLTLAATKAATQKSNGKAVTASPSRAP